MLIPSEKKTKAIRGRKAYGMFKEFLIFLRTNPKNSEILIRVHHILDLKGAFGSIRASEWAFESLEQVFKDIGT